MSDTLKTKRALADALIKLCQTKSFNKISITDITREVGIKRQTFYYHFEDKYMLLTYVYHQTALYYLDDNNISLDNWESQVLSMLKAIKQYAKLYHKTVEADQSILMHELLLIIEHRFKHLFNMFDTQQRISEENKAFYAKFFGYGCSGLLLEWIINNYPQKPAKLAHQMAQLAKDTELFSVQLVYRGSKEEWKKADWLNQSAFRFNQ